MPSHQKRGWRKHKARRATRPGELPAAVRGGAQRLDGHHETARKGRTVSKTVGRWREQRLGAESTPLCRSPASGLQLATGQRTSLCFHRSPPFLTLCPGVGRCCFASTLEMFFPSPMLFNCSVSRPQNDCLYKKRSQSHLSSIKSPLSFLLILTSFETFVA